jgi:predicted unusual protein kinase regulating ubiquinone biosynthesis (AarF/ABC1/UbiB family)
MPRRRRPLLRRPGHLSRPIHVFLALFPFVLSFVRDWRGLIFVGAPRVLDEAAHARRARRLSETFARLGPTFIKAAQVLAQREDLIPAVYTRALRRLQDRVPPFPTPLVLATIEASLGRPAREVFQRFDERPLAAASLGQVHRAAHDGREVAVKVLRPHVRELVRIDLAVVRFLLAMAAPFLDDNVMASARAVLDEYGRMMEREMDFRNERDNAARLRANLAANPGVIVPDFLDEYTTPDVVVMEFVDGVRIDDGDALRAMGFDPMEIVRRLILAYARMAVIDGFIHADPHPGNLLVDRQGRIVILDHGMTLEFDNFTRLELLAAVRAVYRRDIDTLMACYERLGLVDPGMNRGTLREAARTLLDIQLDSDASPRQVQEIARDILNTFHRFPLRLPQNLVYLLRATSLLEGIALTHNPRYHAARAALPIIRELLAELGTGAGKPWTERLVDGARSALSTGRDLLRIINRLEREELQVRLHEVDITGAERFLAAVLRRALAGIAIAFGSLIATLVCLHANRPFLLVPLLGGAAIVLLIVGLLPLPPRGGRRLGPFFK